MATASSKEELREIDERVHLWLYIRNLQWAEKYREFPITVRDTINTRGSLMK